MEIEYRGRESSMLIRDKTALSSSDRKPGQGELQRPRTAPSQLPGRPHVALREGRKVGRLSLLDKEENGEAHVSLGPKVLRDLDRPRHGLPMKGPDQFLKQGDGHSLRTRVKLKELLRAMPMNREPPFRRGTGGVHLSFESVPPAGSIFRYLYGNGTIDFVSLRWATSTNEVFWGERRGTSMEWSERPGPDVEVSRWLPIFLEGLREYEEPYRFLSIMGSQDLIELGGAQLHMLAADLVPPFQKCLDTREPTAVAVALELMSAVLRADPKVADTWIFYLGHFSQVLNLFISRGFLVNMGYNTRQVRSLRATIHEFLVLLQQGVADPAVALACMRRHMRTDPIVTDNTMRRQTRQAEEKPTFQTWKPYTLI